MPRQKRRSGKAFVMWLNSDSLLLKAIILIFVKRDRNKITTPVVNKAMSWDFKHIKELCGQGKLYIRLNVPKESVETIESNDASEGEDPKSDEELMRSSGVLRNPPAKRLCSMPRPVGVISIEDDDAHATEASTIASARSNQTSTSNYTSYKNKSDKEKLKELLPNATEKQLDKALSESYSLAGSANALLQDNSTCNNDHIEEKLSSSEDEEELTLTKITQKLSRKLTGIN